MIETAIKLCWEVDGRGRNRRCRDWEGCPGHDWYSHHDNQYCRCQCIWIIDNCIEYVNGVYVCAGWPEDKPETGYDDVHVQRSQPSTAGFTIPVQEIVEVIYRLERTGKDGRLLLVEVKNAELRLRGGKYQQHYSQEARDALNYCCGWKRKRQPYRQWLADRERKQREKP